MMSTKKSIPLAYLLRVTHGDCWIIHWMLLGSQVFNLSQSITRETHDISHQNWAQSLTAFFISDDRYVIVKRKNANGSKTPPKKKSTSKTHSGNGSSVIFPDPYDTSRTQKCSCSHISGASICSDNPSNYFSIELFVNKA